jgi:hypothetical protein
MFCVVYPQFFRPHLLGASRKMTVNAQYKKKKHRKVRIADAAGKVEL